MKSNLIQKRHSIILAEFGTHITGTHIIMQPTQTEKYWFTSSDSDGEIYFFRWPQYKLEDKHVYWKGKKVNHSLDEHAYLMHTLCRTAISI